MSKKTPDISTKFGLRLGEFKKNGNVSYAIMSAGTSISANHINNTVKGKTNPTLKQINAYAQFFGVHVYEMLQFDAPVPARETLEKNIKAHFDSIGYISSESFKKLGPSYLVEEFLGKYGAFRESMEASKIKDLFNAARNTSYKTNDISRVLDRLAEEDLLIKIKTANPKKPKYDTPK